MAYTLFIFFPVATCLFWLVLHCVMGSKMETFHEMAILCILCGVYLFSDACHATQVSGSPLDTGSLIAALFAGPCIIPMIIMYLQKLLHHRNRHYLAMLWIVVPTVLFTGGVILNLLNYDERINRAFATLTGPVFHGVLACELIILLLYIIKLLRYDRILTGSIVGLLFRGKPISLARLQIGVVCMPLSIMVLRIFISDNLYTVKPGSGIPWVAIISAAILTITLFLFAMNALFGMRSKVTLEDFRYIIRYNYGLGDKSEVIEEIVDELLDEAEEDALKHIQVKLGENLHSDQYNSYSEAQGSLATKIYSAVSETVNKDGLIYRFQHLMKEEKAFLSPKLTLDDVAEKLHSNKTYVSKLVNNTYNLGFPELINILRVDYAEQYMMMHRDAKQEEIAQESGFLSASSFNTTFKNVTGTTPKVWLASVKAN